MAFNFGTPAGNPAGGGGTNFNFGASTPKPVGLAPTTFGTSTPTFGTPTSIAAPAFGSANLTLSQPNNSLQQQHQSTGLLGSGFGAPQTAFPSAAPPAFGNFGTLSNNAKPTGTVQPLLSAAPVLPTFGQATAAQAAAAAAASQPQATTLTSTAPLNFGGFGGMTNTSVAPTSLTTATVAPNQLGGGFGAAAAQNASLFGKPNTLLTTMTTTATPAAVPSLFGSAAPAAAAAGSGLFGGASTATTGAPNAGLFGAANTTSTLFGATANSAAAPAPQPKLGLGGVDTNAAQPKTVEGRSESARTREAQLPQEIVGTVDALKLHIKQQKQFSSDIARTSTHKLFNVSVELQSLNWALAEVANCVQTNHAAIKQLRYETAGAIRQAEMAQRTHEIQPGLQFENTAPLRFFAELVQRFEADMISFRNQVELTEKHMRSLANPQSFTADDLKKGLHQIHESFIALAGRLHETHQKVESQKEQYLNLRKHLLKDKTNVFAADEADGSDRLQTMANISCGPTPFSATFGINLGVAHHGQTFQATTTTSGTSATAQQQQNASDVSGFGLLGRGQLQQPSGAGGGAFFGASSGQQPFGNSSGGAAAGGLSFGLSSAFGSSNAAVQPAMTLSTTGGGPFNLQSPPIGTKRNKQ